MTRVKLRKKCAAAVILTMFISLFFLVLSPVRAEAAEGGGTVTFSVERFTLGQGFYVEPIEVPFEEGDTGYDLLMRAVPNAAEVLHFDNDTYLAWIAGCDLGWDALNIPDYIFDISDGQLTTEHMQDYLDMYEDNGLGEFSYSKWSGWMYSVNNVFPEYGLNQYEPKDGDVVRWQFTLYGHGTDVEGKAFGETEYRVKLSNKDEAMKLLAKVNGNEALLDYPDIKAAYDKTKALVQNPIASQDEVDQCVEDFKALFSNIYPESITLDSTAKELYVGDESFQLKATLFPTDALEDSVKWSSSDSTVASVDQSGKVTPKKGGEATITAETANGLTAECKITVKERPITGVALKPTEIKLVTGGSAALQATITPENTTDSKALKWTSADTSVATVEDGEVKAVSPGETVIAVETVNGLKAECRVTVSEDYDKLLLDLRETIAALPEVSALTLEDETAVDNAQALYNSLPETYKKQLTEGELSKLEASVKVMDALKDDRQKAQDFTQKVEALTAPEEITVSDNDRVKALVDIVNTWDGLTSKQQGMVDSQTLEKYENCRSKLAALRDEVAAIDEKIMALKPYIEAAEDFNLGDVTRVVEARSAYNSLCPYLQDMESVKAGWLSDNAGSVLLYGERLVRSVFAAEIDALDITDEDSVVSFVHTMSIYDAMPEDQQPNFGEDIATCKNSIAAKYHKSDVLTVSGDSLPWNVKLVVKEVTSDSQLAKAAEAFYGDGSEMRKAYTVTFEEIGTGKAYTPAEDLNFILSYKPAEGEEAENFRIFRQDNAAAGTGLIEKLTSQRELSNLEDISYDAQSGLWQFSAKAPGTFGIVYGFVPLTGIAIDASATELEEGTSLTLTARAIPENATLGDDGLQLEWTSSDASVVSVDSAGQVKALKAGGSAIITATVKNQPDIKASITITTKASAAVTAMRDSLRPSVAQMLKETANYVVETELAAEAEQAGSIGYSSQWNVIAIARAREIAASAGMDTSRWDELISTFYNNAAGQYKKDGGTIPGDGDRRKTEYSKFILTLTACGYDAREVSEEKYNVFDNLRDFKQVKSQGTNGPIWALIALKCSDKYQGALPTTEAEAAATGLENPTSEEKLLNYVLDSQLADGGWSLSGSKADSDMTGMALQSLWSYYAKADNDKTDFEKSVSSKVSAAVERGLSCLRNIQMATGGFGSAMGAASQETEESICQVVVALTGLGLEPADSKNGFVKSGGQWTMSALTRYYVSGGGFMHLLPGSGDDGGAKPGERNGMATEQGLYTLVAYQRFAQGKNGLYNMNDEKIAGGQAATGGVTSNASSLQGSGSGKSASGSGSGGGQKADAGNQPGSGWSFDTLMAGNDRSSAATGLTQEQLKNISLVLGLCGIAVLAVFMIVRTIYNLCIKPYRM